jgi:enoyl-CoA hydratase/carnithine racemase
MTRRLPITPIPLDHDVDASMLRFKRSFEAHVATITGSLAQSLEEHHGDHAAKRIALLETAIDGYLAERTRAATDLTSAAADATDMVQAVLRRAVQKRRAALRMSMAAIPPASANPADNEESANRPTDTLKLLDTLAARVPDHLVSRDELASASETLAVLLGWFAGAIDQPTGAGKASQ